MLFGLNGALASFQQMMDWVINGQQDIVAAYLDDLVVFNNTCEEHLKHLKEVLSRLRNNGLTAKQSIC